MRRLLRAGALVGAALILVAADAPPPVKLDAPTQRRLAVATAPLVASSQTTTVDGFAKVLDPGPLAQLESDLATAEAAAEASKAEADRSKALNGAGAAISAKALEAAVAQARSDQIKVTLLRRRLGLEWGPSVARMPAGRLSALLTEIATGRAALIRIDTAGGVGLTSLHAADIDLGGGGKVHAVVLGPSRAADPKLLSPGLIAVVTGPQAALAASGLTATMSIPTGPPAAGVIIPRGAVIRAEGQAWAYVRVDGGSFQRRLLDSPKPVTDGLFVTTGFRPGEAVVTQGAQALYAAEVGSGDGG